MVLAMWREQRAARMHTKTNVKTVGIRPERWNVAGRWSMAGPVNELQAIAKEPRYPILPVMRERYQ